MGPLAWKAAEALSAVSGEADGEGEGDDEGAAASLTGGEDGALTVFSLPLLLSFAEESFLEEVLSFSTGFSLEEASLEVEEDDDEEDEREPDPEADMKRQPGTRGLPRTDW